MKGLTECIRRIYDEEKDSDASTIPACGFEIDSQSPGNKFVIQSFEFWLCTKGLSSANSWKNLFRKIASFRGFLQREPKKVF